ncbi:MAG: EAL domain-containing protein [Burkholderiales bacterium]
MPAKTLPRFKLILTAIMLCGIVLIGAIWMVVQERIIYERAATLADQSRDNTNLARVLEEQILSSLMDTEQLLRLVRHQDQYSDPNVMIERMFEDLILNRQQFDAVGAIDEHGKVIFATRDLKPGNYLFKTALGFHQAHNDDRLLIGKPVRSHINNKDWVIPLSLRLNKQNGGFGGIVFACIKPAYFNFFFDNIQLSKTAGFQLLGTDGVVRAQVGSQDADPHDGMMSRTLLVAQAGNRKGSFTSQHGGATRLVSYQVLDRYPLIVMISSSQAEALAPFHQRQRIYCLVATLSSAFVLAFTLGLILMLWRQRRYVENLQDKEMRLSLIYENASNPIFVVDVGADDHFHFSFVNPSFLKVTGLTQAQVIGRAVTDVIPQASHALVLGKYKEAIRTGQSISWTEISRYPAGEKTGEVTVSPVIGADGHCSQLIGVVYDITERRKADEKIQLLTRLYAALSQCNQTIVRGISEAELFHRVCQIVVDTEVVRAAAIGKVNAASGIVEMVATYGEGIGFIQNIRKSIVADEPEGRGLVGSAIRDKQPSWCQDYLNDPRTVPWHEEAVHFGVNSAAALPLYCGHVAVGAFILLSDKIGFFDEPVRELLMEMATDISHALDNLAREAARKAAEAEIEHLAYFDGLTQLPNRHLLIDRLHQVLVSSTRGGHAGALLLIDLDNFKTLNDTLGHDVGDLLLQQTAQRLVRCVRAEDTVARVGGDEFMVLIENLGLFTQEAAALARTVGEKILATLNQPYLLAEYEHSSSPSMGIVLFADISDSVEELLKRADLAMYQAKAAGRNTLRFFDPQMQARAMARAALETDLRLGVQADQFLLYYQPQVNSEGCLTGAEALLRWQHPRRGMVPPAEFIPLAEDTGLILPLGQWVLETACAQLAAWADDPLTARLALAVNVSARQFRHKDFVDQVLAVLDQSRADSQKLKLELTESLLVDDVEDIIGKMNALKARGVNFSLDDFGTGYSSLTYLKRLPLYQLKIDQSFVRDVLTDPNDAAIARTIVALANSLNLAVIAEGVETEAQRDFLAGIGCYAYQGYLYSQPLALQAFEAFVSQIGLA